MLAADSADQPQAVADTADVSRWRDPSAWTAPEAQPPLTSHLVLRGQFARPAMQGDTRLALFIDRLGGDQKVYLNGQQVQPKEVDGALVVEVAAASLKASNSLAYVLSTPKGGVQGMFDSSAGTSKWGVLRTTAPAAPWQRSVFNGWAQVIVQSTGQPGAATLSATSGKLTETALRFELR